MNYRCLYTTLKFKIRTSQDTFLFILFICNILHEILIFIFSPNCLRCPRGGGHSISHLFNQLGLRFLKINIILYYVCFLDAYASLELTLSVTQSVTQSVSQSQRKLSVIQNHPRLIQTYPDLSRPIQTNPNLSKPNQTYPNLCKSIQTYPILTKPIPNLSIPIQTYQKPI